MKSARVPRGRRHAEVTARSRRLVGPFSACRRDGYVRNRILETEKFQTVELSPTALRALPAGSLSANTSGPVTLELLADLTVRGVTKATTWRVTARQTNGQVTGTASTRFTFADFGIMPPKVPILLSVADTIGLEYNFALTRN